MVDDVVLNKVGSIERYLKRISEEYIGHESELETNFTRQDAIVLNTLRACETAIDLAMHVVKVRGLGVLQSSRHAFELLEEAGLISNDVRERMKRMVGFRKVAVHNYTTMSIPVLRSIIEERLPDFRSFAEAMLRSIPQSHP